MDRIFIEGLELRARIGVWEWERQLQQRLRLDLELGVELGAATASDALDDAVSYSAVAEFVNDTAAASDYQLMEALAEALAIGIRERFPVHWLRLTLHKPGAVAGARSVGVCIERGGTATP